MEYYSAIKKDEILPSGTTWMHLERAESGIMVALSKVWDSEKCEDIYMV